MRRAVGMDRAKGVEEPATQERDKLCERTMKSDRAIQAESTKSVEWTEEIGRDSLLMRAYLEGGDMGLLAAASVLPEFADAPEATLKRYGHWINAPERRDYVERVKVEAMKNVTRPLMFEFKKGASDGSDGTEGSGVEAEAGSASGSREGRGEAHGGQVHAATEAAAQGGQAPEPASAAGGEGVGEDQEGEEAAEFRRRLEKRMRDAVGSVERN